MLDEIVRPAEGGDHLLEGFGRAAAASAAAMRSRRWRRRGELAQHQHLGAELHRDVDQPRLGGAAASTSMASRVSSALPATEASGASMSVISATVGRPAPRATATRLSASSRAASSEGRKAPSRP